MVFFIVYTVIVFSKFEASLVTNDIMSMFYLIVSVNLAIFAFNGPPSIFLQIFNKVLDVFKICCYNFIGRLKFFLLCTMYVLKAILFDRFNSNLLWSNHKQHNKNSISKHWLLLMLSLVIYLLVTFRGFFWVWQITSLVFLTTKN